MWMETDNYTATQSAEVIIYSMYVESHLVFSLQSLVWQSVTIETAINKVGAIGNIRRNKSKTVCLML